MFLYTLAHLGGRSFSAAVSFIVTTLIATQLGPAAMGIFGVYMVIQGLMGILDGGMSASINRAMAIGTSGAQAQDNHTRLFRTYEIVNIGIACLIALGVKEALPWVIEQWKSDSATQIPILSHAIFFGLALAFRFTQTLYLNVLFGSQHHIRANAVIGVFACFRAALIVTALVVLKLDLNAVFIALTISNGLEALTLVLTCWYKGIWKLATRPSVRLFKDSVSFMAPISGYTIIALILSQADRIIIGHLVSIEQFGFYSLVASYAAGVNALAYAPANVFYPTITQAMHKHDEDAAVKAVKRALHLILMFTFPIGIWAVFYGADIGSIVFKDTSVAAIAAPLWAPLFLACCINVLDIIPQRIFLAQNRADIILKVNIFKLALYPLGFAGGIYIWGYPDGLFALPALSALSLAAFLVCLGFRGKMEKGFVRNILMRSSAVFAVMAAFYAISHATMGPLPSLIVMKILLVGWPLGVVGVAFWSLVVFRFRKT